MIPTPYETATLPLSDPLIIPTLPLTVWPVTMTSEIETIFYSYQSSQNATTYAYDFPEVEVFTTQISPKYL